MDIKISDERWNKIIVDVVEDRMHEIDSTVQSLGKLYRVLDNGLKQTRDKKNELMREWEELDDIRDKANAHTN